MTWEVGASVIPIKDRGEVNPRNFGMWLEYHSRHKFGDEKTNVRLLVQQLMMAVAKGEMS
jgi:hypothetical protein